MKVSFEKSFGRDLKRIKDKKLLQRVKQVIENVKSAPKLGDIKNLIKMKSYATFYRIRLGDYRIGI
jgi:mRNA interferase RelE/StbE